MISNRLLERLECVRMTGQHTWIARCPSHDDRSPSLAIREVDDRLLVHCFAGCQVTDVVTATGLKISHLFPDCMLDNTGKRPLRRPFPASDVLLALNQEVVFLQVCAFDISKGKALTYSDLKRLHIAASRFRAALIAGGIK